MKLVMSYLEKLIGKKITEIHSGFLETFEFFTKRKEEFESNNIESKEAEINIYLRIFFNDYSLEIYNLEIVNGLPNQTLENLKGLKVENIIEDESHVIIYLSDKIEMKVNINPQSFIGAEAMCLHGPNNLIVVWN